MFKFDFDVEDDSVEEAKLDINENAEPAPDERSFEEHSLQDLVSECCRNLLYTADGHAKLDSGSS
jgi:hypothetical protein